MSLFDLPTEPAESEDVTRWYYQKITANGANTTQVNPSTTLSFQFAPQGRRWFVPSRSFFQVTASVASTNTQAAVTFDATAAARGKQSIPLANAIPAIGGAANIFRSCRVLIGGTVVSAVESSMTQIEVINNRVGRTSNYLRTGGNSFNAWSSVPYKSSWPERPVDPATLTTTLNYSWCPPCGFFDIEHAIPGLEMTLELSFDPDVAAKILEVAITDAPTTLPSLTADTKYFGVTTNTTGPQVTNINVEFHAAFVEGPRADETKFVLNFNEWAAHVQPYNSNNNFVVRPETDMLVVAMQHKDAGKEITRPAGRFIFTDPVVETAGAAPGFVPTYSSYLKPGKLMKEVQVEYNGQLFPAQAHPMTFSRLAVDNAINNGLYWTTGETEDFVTTQALGQIMVLQTPKDGTSYATAVRVMSTSTGGAAAADYNTMLFARTPRSFLIRTVDSMVVTVQTADVARSGSDRGLQGSSVQGSGHHTYGGRRPFASNSFI